jgi:hypothetical protein
VPAAVMSANNKNKGRSRIFMSGVNRQKTINAIRITKDIKKSIKQTITVLAGTINLGKYTLVSRFEFATNELLASLNAEEKNTQGKVAAAT